MTYFPSDDPDRPYAGSWCTIAELQDILGLSYGGVYSRIRRQHVPTMRRPRTGRVGKPLVLARPEDFPLTFTRHRRGK